MARFLSSRLRGWLTAPGHSTVLLLLLFLLLFLLALRLRTLLSFIVVSHQLCVGLLDLHDFTIDTLDI